jgi:hypothetical protein
VFRDLPEVAIVGEQFRFGAHARLGDQAIDRAPYRDAPTAKRTEQSRGGDVTLDVEDEQR